MNMLLKKLWHDEVGALLSLEAVILATFGSLAVTGGVASLSNSVNSEFGDLSAAVLSFDQSYSTNGYSINGNVGGGTSGGSGSRSSGFGFSGYKAPSGFRQQGGGGVNFGSAASQQFQQPNFTAPNFEANFVFEEIAGDTVPSNGNVFANFRGQPQASRQQSRVREQVLIDDLGDDSSDYELQTIVVPRNRRGARASTF